MISIKQAPDHPQIWHPIHPKNEIIYYNFEEWEYDLKSNVKDWVEKNIKNFRMDNRSHYQNQIWIDLHFEDPKDEILFKLRWM